MRLDVASDKPGHVVGGVGLELIIRLVEHKYAACIDFKRLGYEFDQRVQEIRQPQNGKPCFGDALQR